MTARRNGHVTIGLAEDRTGWASCGGWGRRHGHEAVVLFRAAGVDLVAGDGLAGLLRGATAVIDVTNIAAPARMRRRVLRAATLDLSAAEQQAGVQHDVALSIVGVDRVAGNGHYRGSGGRKPSPRSGSRYDRARDRVPRVRRDGGELVPQRRRSRGTAAAGAARRCGPCSRCPGAGGAGQSRRDDRGCRARAAGAGRYGAPHARCPRAKSLCLFRILARGLWYRDGTGEVLLPGPGCRDRAASSSSGSRRVAAVTASRTAVRRSTRAAAHAARAARPAQKITRPSQ